MEETPQPERKRIESIELVKIWKGDYKDNEAYSDYYSDLGIVTINNCAISSTITIDNQLLPEIQFINCEIKGITLSNNTNQGAILIVKCNVGRLIISKTSISNLEFNNSVFQRISILKESSVLDLHVENQCQIDALNIQHGCNVRDFMEISDSSVNKLLLSTDCYIDDVQINNSTITDFTVSNSSQIDSIIIQANSVVSSFNLKTKCKLTDIQIIGASNVSSIVIDYSTTDNIEINNSQTGNIRINEAQILDFDIEGSCIGNLDIHSNTKINTLSVGSTQAANIHINTATVIEFEVFTDSIINMIDIAFLEDGKTLTIFDSFINTLSLLLYKQFAIVANNTTINYLDFGDSVFSKDTYINISNISVHFLNIASCLNLGTIIFNNIIPINEIDRFESDRSGKLMRNKEGKYSLKKARFASHIRIENSDLGKTQFISCNLNKFSNFSFKNSKILDVFVADTELPKKDQMSAAYDGSVSGKERSLRQLEQQRLALSQFKKIYENRGDIVRATQYLAEEMEVYREQLKHQKITNSVEWWNNKSERFNLWLNQFSSNYGNNWLKAACWTLLINAGLFTIYCWRLGFGIAVPNDKSWAMFKKLFSYSFEFLNPLRKADFLQSVAEPTNSARVVDYISRIIIAYFVYQTIAAFRKFGKKST